MADSGGEQASNKRRVTKSSLFIGVGLAVAVLLLVAVVFYLLKTAKVVEPVALKVGDNEVSSSQYKEYVRLGKAGGASEAEVKANVVQYEKNVQLSKKYNISIPDDYVQQVNSQDTLDQILQLTRGESSTVTSRNAYTDIVKYNDAFEARLAQQNLEGYGVLVYEISAQRTTREGDISEAMKQAKSVATRYRNKITSKQATAAEVLNEVKSYNAQNGQTAKSGLQFLTKNTSGFDDSATGSVASQSYLLQQLAGKTEGLTEVKESKTGSVYFIDVLYVQKKRDTVVAEVEQGRNKMKVVEYDV